jgi:endoglucanase
MDVSGGGTTDATAIQLTREGIHTGLISVATRYIHSPVEVLSIKDLEACAELIARALETAPRYFKKE